MHSDDTLLGPRAYFNPIALEVRLEMMYFNLSTVFIFWWNRQHEYGIIWQFKIQRKFWKIFVKYCFSGRGIVKRTFSTKCWLHQGYQGNQNPQSITPKYFLFLHVTISLAFQEHKTTDHGKEWGIKHSYPQCQQKEAKVYQGKVSNVSFQKQQFEKPAFKVSRNSYIFKVSKKFSK